MSEVLEVGPQAIAAIELWLKRNPETVDVQKVQDNPAYASVGVDFLWTTSQETYTLFVIGDRWEEAGHFSFETHSNEEQNALGSFLYTQAQFIFYYFTASGMLYILPMPGTREWLMPKLEAFPERRMIVSVAEGGDRIALGRLVPISAVLASVPNVEEVQLD